MSDLIDTSTKEGGKTWALLCQKAFENLSTDTAVTFEDVDAILTWVLPEYEEITAPRRFEAIIAFLWTNPLTGDQARLHPADVTIVRAAESP